MRYLVTLAGETLQVDLEREASGDYIARAPGRPELRLEVLDSAAGLSTLLVEGRVIEVQSAEHEVSFEQERFSVHAESSLDRARLRSAAGQGATAKRIVASMPGRILHVACAVGNTVSEGSPVIVMEAMKMQNELCAKVEAVVRAVHVQVGQTVERGALLIEFE